MINPKDKDLIRDLLIDNRIDIQTISTYERIKERKYRDFMEKVSNVVRKVGTSEYDNALMEMYSCLLDYIRVRYYIAGHWEDVKKRMEEIKRIRENGAK